ncbi:adenylosuccinate lyase [Lutibacter citreus]|uniref:adenylosuccinate lyase n=1 Tax=Lutibacter citreus TaxID=2138210 RepID=UPI000DBEA186|nr:adenylosuccinate lyase [Lutibacter citreus]
MTKVFLIQELENLGSALRVNRNRIRDLVIDNPELFPFLLEISFNVNDKVSIKAAWVLELVCEQKIDWVAPYLDLFTLNIGKAYLDSAVRPLSKICNFIAITFNSKKDSILKNTLSKKHINAIIETGFDWMISNHKVATKAYAMNFLYIFGKNSDWVHKELKLIIQQNIPKESPAYKARGKITLDLINRQ